MALSLRRWATGVQEAQGAVEYGLLTATIAVFVLLGTYSFGQVLQSWCAWVIGRVVATGGS